MQAAVSAIEYYLPEDVVSTSDLSAEFPDWSVEKIDEKTGIRHQTHRGGGRVRVGPRRECRRTIIRVRRLRPGIDRLYPVVHPKSGLLPADHGVCSTRPARHSDDGRGFGFQWLFWFCLRTGPGAGSDLFRTGVQRAVDHGGDIQQTHTPSRQKRSHHIWRRRRGDAGEGRPLGDPNFFIYGTDGRGGPNLIVPTGGMRRPRSEQTAIPIADKNGNVRSMDNLFMNGAELQFHADGRAPMHRPVAGEGFDVHGRHRPVRLSSGQSIHARASTRPDWNPRREVCRSHGPLRQHGLLDDSHCAEARRL